MRWLLRIIVLLPLLATADAQYNSFPPGVFTSRARDPAPGAPPLTAWNPADKNANVTLSGSNLIATHTGATAQGGVRAVASHSTGKYCYIITMTSYASNTAVGLGLGNSTESLATFVGNTSTNSGGIYDDGTFRINGSTIGTGNTWTVNAGHTIGIATDLDNNRFWFKVDGGNWNNNGSSNFSTGVGSFSLSTLAGGPYFPMINLYSNAPDVFTGNFDSTVAPCSATGFSNW